MKSVPSITLFVEQLIALNGMLVGFFLGHQQQIAMWRITKVED